MSLKKVKLKIYGIYKIWFENSSRTPDGNYKVYVGLGDVHGRKSDHVSYLKRNAHGNDLLQRAFNKYGLENMRFAVIETCEVAVLEEREIYWIAQHNSNNPAYGYNLTSGGQRTILNEDARRKMSQAMQGNQNGKGKVNPPHVAEAARQANLGNKYNLGKKRPPEVAAKAQETMRRNGYVRPPWSEETRRKHEESNFHHTGETKEIIAEASRKMWETRDRTVSEEMREKNRVGHLGLKATDEAIAKMSESMKKVEHSEDWNSKVSQGLKRRHEMIKSGELIPAPQKDKSGIYKINFVGSDISFIDYVSGLKKRKRYVLGRLESGKFTDKMMQEIYNQFGEGNYKFTVLEYCEIENLDERRERVNYHRSNQI